MLGNLEATPSLEEVKVVNYAHKHDDRPQPYDFEPDRWPSLACTIYTYPREAAYPSSCG